MNYLLFCEKFLFSFLGFETDFGLWSWEFSLGELFIERIYSALLSIVIFRNDVYFKEDDNVIVSFDSTDSTQQI